MVWPRLREGTLDDPLCSFCLLSPVLRMQRCLRRQKWSIGCLCCMIIDLRAKDISATFTGQSLAIANTFCMVQHITRWNVRLCDLAGRQHFTSSALYTATLICARKSRCYTFVECAYRVRIDADGARLPDRGKCKRCSSLPELGMICSSCLCLSWPLFTTLQGSRADSYAKHGVECLCSNVVGEGRWMVAFHGSASVYKTVIATSERSIAWVHKRDRRC